MEWWQILLICIGSVIVWVGLSALLYKQFFKRFYDIVLSGMAILFLSPLLIILAIVGAIAMKGNPFFTQARPGRRKKLSKKQCKKQGVPYGTYGKERIFKLIKFRTMSNAKDKDGNLLPDEVRLNKYGKFLRSTSLDELPELLNIFIGNMSIIGPRPQLVRDMVFMSDEHRQRHNVRQGLSGLAQIRGRNAISWENKLDTDLEYIKKITLWGDICIIFQTVIKAFFKKEGITEEGMATAQDYGDYLLREGKVSLDEYREKQEEAKRLLSEAE